MKKILFLLFLTCGFLFSSAEDRKEFPVKEEPQISVLMLKLQNQIKHHIFQLNNDSLNIISYDY